ncbi:MAG: TVP38/TMEM64 family protein [Eubacteriales bacterium]|nr:TVP38/TMEM64 family protein [Eubacteriales bacterium]
MKQRDLESRRKIVQILSILTVVVLLGLASVFLLPVFLRDPKALKELFSGTWGVLIFLALQILQVFIALLPGEVVELAAGYSFGTFWGTVLVYAGIAIGATLTFFLIRRFGKAAVDTLIDDRSRRKVFRLLNSEKRDYIVFLLYFIPGTPKDLFNFIVPLTKMSYGRFMLITMIARFPAVISSTISGQLIEQKSWLFFGIVYGLTAVLSVIGSIVYKKMMERQGDVVKLSPSFLPVVPYAAPFTATEAAIRAFRAGELDGPALKSAVSTDPVTDEKTLVAAVQSCLITGEDGENLLTAHPEIKLSPRGAAELFFVTADPALLPQLENCDDETADVFGCCVQETDVLLYLRRRQASGEYQAGARHFRYEAVQENDGVRLTIRGDKPSFYRLGLYLPSDAVALNGRPVRPGRVIWFEKRHRREETYFVSFS